MSDIFSLTISKLLNENEQNYFCPFCGAESNFINVSKLDVNNDIFRPNGQYSFKREFGLIKVKPIEFHCTKCLKSWVIDNDGNEYNITKNSDNAENDFNIFKNNTLNVLKFSDFYRNTKNTNVLEEPNGQKITQQTENYITKEEVTDDIKECLLKKKEKNKSEITEKQKQIKLQKKYDLLYNNGEFFASQKTIKPKIFKAPVKESSLFLDSVKKLDEEFNLQNRMVRLVEKHDKCSDFEQRISKFINENKNYTFSDFIIYLYEYFPEESKYIKTIKESILEKEVNEEIDIAERIRHIEELKRKMQEKIKEYDEQINQIKNKRIK